MENNVFKLIIERKCGFMEQALMSPEQATINQILYGLDLARHRAELRWGVGRLIELAPEDLRNKWVAQGEKSVSAIIANDVALVEELVAGSIRGWDALERSAVALGHVPYEAQFWEVMVEDVVYRVVRSAEDAHVVIFDSERPVVALEELVRVYHGRRKEALIRRPSDELRGEYKASGLPMDQPLGF